MPRPITAAMLYDFATCEHRVAMDLFASPAEREPDSEFVRLLWEHGTLFELTQLDRVAADVLDLSGESPEDREHKTLEAMRAGVSLLYHGRLRAGRLLGEPDLLRQEGAGYVPIDVKSGSAFEGGEEEGGRMKKSYALQLALYVDALGELGLSAGRYGYIWDRSGAEVRYELGKPQGPRSTETPWDMYQGARARVTAIVDQGGISEPAYAASCKLCPWRSACLKRLEARDDLTLLPELGRAKRTALAGTFRSIRSLASADPEVYIAKGKTQFRGIGPDTLRTLHARAKLRSDPNARPYLKAAHGLSAQIPEIWFDIEADPFRDLVYLHGLVVRDAAGERYHGCFARSADPTGEREAFEQAMAIFRAYPSAPVYVYSKYERTQYRNLQARYPEAASPEEIEVLFDETTGRCVDLLDVVRRCTEWPTRDYSIKTLAKYLGFAWRDSNPSGAASIEWYHRWCETGDGAIRQRLLEYNEDDCVAMEVLRDGILGLRT